MDTTVISLVAKAKNGDKQAFGELYSQIYTDLYRFAYYTLNSKEDAEDAVSEAFIEGFRGIAGLRDDALFKAWMMRILSIRCKRKIKSYIITREKISPDDISDHVISADMNMDSDEKIALMSALKTIDENEKAILLLSVVEGFKVREIADILGCPMGTVSSKLHRTLKKLREQLERK